MNFLDLFLPPKPKSSTKKDDHDDAAAIPALEAGQNAYQKVVHVDDDDPSVYVGFDEDRPTKRMISGHHTLVVGATGSGKTRRVLGPATNIWDGPVVNVSSKPDMVAMTCKSRQYAGGQGHTYFLDLAQSITDEQLPAGVQRLYFDPCRLIQTDSDAMRMVDSFRGTQSSRSNDGDFWEALAAPVAAAMLRAGSLHPDGIRWVMQAKGRSEAGCLLLDSVVNDDDELPSEDWTIRNAPPSWDAAILLLKAAGSDLWMALRDIRTRTDGQIASTGIYLDSWLGPWTDPALCPPEGEDVALFTPTLLQNNRATLYIVAAAGGVSNMITLICFDTILNRWRKNQTENERLPRLLFVVDELCNTAPWLKLPVVVTEARGMGVAVLAGVQSTEQFVRQFGGNVRDELRDVFPSFLCLPGADERHLWDRVERQRAINPSLPAPPIPGAVIGEACLFHHAVPPVKGDIAVDDYISGFRVTLPDISDFDLTLSFDIHEDIYPDMYPAINFAVAEYLDMKITDIFDDVFHSDGFGHVDLEMTKRIEDARTERRKTALNLDTHNENLFDDDEDNPQNDSFKGIDQKMTERTEHMKNLAKTTPDAITHNENFFDDDEDLFDHVTESNVTKANNDTNTPQTPEEYVSEKITCRSASSFMDSAFISDDTSLDQHKAADNSRVVFDDDASRSQGMSVMTTSKIDKHDLFMSSFKLESEFNFSGLMRVYGFPGAGLSTTQSNNPFALWKGREGEAMWFGLLQSLPADIQRVIRVYFSLRNPSDQGDLDCVVDTGKDLYFIDVKNYKVSLSRGYYFTRIDDDNDALPIRVVCYDTYSGEITKLIRGGDMDIEHVCHNDEVVHQAVVMLPDSVEHITGEENSKYEWRNPLVVSGSSWDGDGDIPVVTAGAMLYEIETSVRDFASEFSDDFTIAAQNVPVRHDLIARAQPVKPEGIYVNKAHLEHMTSDVESLLPGESIHINAGDIAMIHCDDGGDSTYAEVKFMVRASREDIQSQAINMKNAVLEKSQDALLNSLIHQDYDVSKAKSVEDLMVTRHDEHHYSINASARFLTENVLLKRIACDDGWVWVNTWEGHDVK